MMLFFIFIVVFVIGFLGMLRKASIEEKSRIEERGRIEEEKETKKTRPWATKEAHDRYLREKEIRQKERMRRENEELERAYAIHAAKDISNEYAIVANDFLSVLSNPNSYLEVLTEVKNPDNVKLRLSELDRTQLGDVTCLFVNDHHRNKSDIFDYLKVEDSEMGAWQAFLLHNISSILPTWWHANTMSIQYVFAYKEINSPKILDALTGYHESLAPTVVKEQNYYIVSFCYWNNWIGLVRKSVKVSLNDGIPIFEFLKNDVLFEYNCGIQF